MRLTVKRIERIIRDGRPGRYGDGGGLYLHIRSGGSVQWILRVVAKGRRQDVGIGGFPTVTLPEARDRAFELRRLARRGGDPLALVQSEAAQVPAFGEAAGKTLETHRPKWRDATIRAFLPVLETHCTAIWDEPVDAITRAACIDALKQATGSTVEKLRIRMAQTFDFCAAYGWIESSPMPTNGTLAAVLDTKRERKNHAALHWSKVPEFFWSLPESTAGACMKWIILTACRSTEAREATWSEIDRDAKVWTIPASRTKQKREHRVPLSDAALAVLDSLPRRDSLVFAGSKPGSAVSDESLRRLVKGAGVTTHGMRSACVTYFAEQHPEVPRDVRRSIIAHKVEGEDRTEAAYCRTDYYGARVGLIDAWAAHVLGGE